MCASIKDEIELSRAGQGSVGYREISLTRPHSHVGSNTVHCTLQEARRLIESGEVREDDMLFPMLIDIIANDGGVG